VAATAWRTARTEKGRSEIVSALFHFHAEDFSRLPIYIIARGTGRIDRTGEDGSSQRHFAAARDGLS
jgi:hypothetical protein